ncbi:MAG: ABC transporter substrate-binding protein [Bacilli bacterium]|nr:ABC transporter substrate-binding protein [Bacilli bacterium]
MKKRFLILIMVVCLGALLCGCRENKLTKIELAEVTHSIFYAPLYVAINEGYFEEEGLEISLVNAGGADKVMAALLSNASQVGLAGPEATIYVYNNGQSNYMINFAQLTKRDGSFIVGREKIENFTLKDLRGKSILGGRVGGVPEMTLEYVLKQAGLTVGRDTEGYDVLVRTDIQFNAMTGSFLNGEADFTTMFEPTATLLEKEGRAYVLASVGEFTDEIPFTAFYVTKSYLEENEDVVLAFTKAIYKGQQFVMNKSDEDVAKSVISFFTDSTIDDLTIVIGRYRKADVWCTTPYFGEDGFNRLMDVMEEAKELDKRAPYDKIVNNKFAEEVVK